MSETHGEKEGSAYNGHFACPDMSGLPSAVLLQPVRRPGAVPAAERQRRQCRRLAFGPGAHRGPLPRPGHPRLFRGDAAFARPELYEYLEAEGYLYAIRLPDGEGVLTPP